MVVGPNEVFVLARGVLARAEGDGSGEGSGDVITFPEGRKALAEN